MSDNNTTNTFKTPPTYTGTTGGFKVGKKVVKQKPTTKNPPSSSGTSLLYSEEEVAALLDSDDDDSTPVPPSSDERKKKFDPIATATMDDVVFTLESVNPHKRIKIDPKKPKPRNEDDYTRLVSIGSIAVVKLGLDHIKNALLLGMDLLDMGTT